MGSSKRLKWFRTVRVNHGEFWKIKQSDVEWRIISAHIVHITATLSNFVVSDGMDRTIKYCAQVLAASASGTYNAFPNPTTTAYNQILCSQLLPDVWYDDSKQLFFAGAATAYAMVLVECRRVHAVTRKPL